MMKKLMIGVLSALVVTAVGASAYNTTIKPVLEQAAPQVASASAGTADSSQTAVDATGNNQTASVQAGEQVQSQVQQWRGGGNGQGGPTSGGQPLAGSNNGLTDTSQAGSGGQGRGNGFGGGAGRQSQTGSADGSAVPAPQNGLTEWISLDGTASQVEFPNFTLTTADGQTYPVSVGNLNYAASLGIDLSEGETISLVGFWDNSGTLTVGSLTADGTTYSLRDDYGRPLWSGGASH